MSCIDDGPPLDADTQEPEPTAARAPATTERAAFLAMAQAAGVHGVYVANDLAADRSGRTLAARGLAFYGAQGPRALAWFGARGNLIVLRADGARLHAGELARAIADFDSPWRIALGPPDVIAAIAPRLGVAPSILRRQLYYAADSAAVAARPVDDGVRPASLNDVDALIEAALELNRADLDLDPERVSRRWLEQTTRERVRARTAWVLGPSGAPYAKLDIGSQGAAGAVIEGVFTLPEHRGCGHARALVHAVASRLLAVGRSVVCLHVAENNASARACYTHAGLRESMAVSLLLKAT